MVGVEGYGSTNDSGIVNNCIFGTKMQKGKLQISASKTSPQYDKGGKVQYVFMKNEAFPLCCDLMRPSPYSNKKELDDTKIYKYGFSWEYVKGGFC